MPKNPTFELFETICQELEARGTTVFTRDEVNAGVMADLKDYYNETQDQVAFKAALSNLIDHFKLKNSQLPFQFNEQTGEFAATDPEYITFVAKVVSKRGGVGSDAKQFEVQSTNRLAKRLTGIIHCVGYPWISCHKKRDFMKHLMALGFDKDCVQSKDNDGGLDIIWLPPLGAIPLRPVISLQCKNSSFNEEEANKSIGRAHTTLQRHSHIRGHNQLYFVIFNDYIDDSFQGRGKGLPFVPLGLSDLGDPQRGAETFVL